eukprot:TRINITY_DN3612_c0_g1_i1.p1 TRINITY_DN3612_c0_g1~~TRINITY_DN3612_c0_g1_i1.p1  ORF type:complete len:283 (+),score=114.56 TRINITY_DN3612_c0_g1_i1:27-851(+)
MAEPKTRSWADDDEVDADNDGVKTITEIKTRPDGTKYKLVKKVKKVKKERQIIVPSEDRRLWEKFGDCAGVEGPEVGVTKENDEVFWELNVLNKPKEKTEKDSKAAVHIICRTCGGDHWTISCPNRHKVPSKDDTFPLVASGAIRSGASPTAIGPGSSSTPGSGSYIPPHVRSGTSATGYTRSATSNKNDEATVRVTNVSEDTTEDDLRALFDRKVGNVQRVYLARDKNSGRSKGFAFVAFYERSTAEKAVKLMNNFGFNHLILQVEMSRPSTK